MIRHDNWVLWFVVGLVLVIGCTGLIGLAGDIEDEGGQRQQRTQRTERAPETDLIRDFGCQWIMDTYDAMALVGHDTAVTHVSNAMNIKYDYTEYVGVGDAAASVRRCIDAGY